MPQAIIPSCSSVRCGDGLVILDFDADAYFCHYDAAEREAPSPSPPAEPIWHDAPPAAADIGVVDVLNFLIAYARALLAWPGRPLHSLLTRVAAFHPWPWNEGDPSAEMVAARFERLSLYLPFSQPCTLRSLALLYFLNWYGHKADWVIGAQLFPFRAHCWVAQQSTLLGERAHLIEDYATLYRLGRGA